VVLVIDLTAGTTLETATTSSSAKAGIDIAMRRTVSIDFMVIYSHWRDLWASKMKYLKLR